MSVKFNYDRRDFLGAAMTIAAAGLGMFDATKAQSGDRKAADRLPLKGELPSLSSADAWLNSQPITAKALAGKIVLINFCTYSCINWLRTLPYLRAWDAKYKDRGLVVIGVHTPEFEFEKNLDNVRRAIKDMKIEYPIAVDNDRKIWNAFSNQYWPALYVIDAKGLIKHHQFGEGGYEESETIFQQLLSGTGQEEIGHGLVSVGRMALKSRLIGKT